MRAPRTLRVLAAVGAALVLAALSAAPALATPVPVAVMSACVSSPTADQFEFESFDATYRLDRDGGGRSTLHTTEHLVATFPEFDQNRGIRRALVATYEGHDTAIEIVSVTDEDGTPRGYTTERDDEFLLITIAEPCGVYVHGEQHYVIEYTQHDVTASFSDTDADEFFWDINGVGWAQPFGRVSATVEVASELRSALTGSQACYFGYDQSESQCEIDADNGAFQVSVDDLAPYQNVTVAIGFERGTFAGPPFTSFIPALTLAGVIASLAAIVVAFVLRFAVWRNSPGRGTVIAQYAPADGVSALVAANIVGKPKRGMAAAIVDLAVRRKVRILEHDQGWSKVFGVQKVDSAGLGPDEQRVMGALFSVNPFSFAGILPGLQSIFSSGGQSAVPQPDSSGEVRWLTKGDTVLGQQVVALTKAVAKEVEAGGLRRRPPRLPILIVGALAVLGFLLPLLNVFAEQGGEIAIVVSVFVMIAAPWLAILAIGALVRHRPLTAKGAELREHLEGLREYIRLAEADRLQMLQSVSGAERREGPDGTVVKIYERLLPYAVLFGLEKEWAQEIAKYYDTDPPDWYSGTSGFHIAAFAAGIGSLSSSVSTSYSGSSGSSSSGGSGGGGSSGGGGGGGGGGGV